MSRHFFALDVDKVISSLSCHQCASVKQLPHAVKEQPSTDPPDAVCVSYACDVMKRKGLLIFLLRVTAFTVSCFIDSERAESLRKALLRLCIELRPLHGPPPVFRTDAAPGFKALVNGKLLHRYNVCIALGNGKNPNKHPVAEKHI
ncbi:hypothetical protein SNE40_002758 [Patella caerulea]|uniref:Integrase catalytic domain-containing protein n=1 Tax=Patella caerulea TaxID=87958 RepID=A0AAN8K9C3_PATCE